VDRDHLDAIVRPHSTVSARIRALAAAGVPRAEIARFLGKRYQHVRNVLEDDAQRAGGGYVLGKADLGGVREDGARFEDTANEPEWVERRGMDAYWLRPRADGSVVLPREVAEALGLTSGRRVFARWKDDRLEIVSAATAMAQAREIVRRHVPPGVSLADELIVERRAEAAREDADD
jgi:bifunctional DNA-binding transcriptional regulator/antitoxin component of YhaV-PrlF toxin-antitoxin module